MTTQNDDDETSVASVAASFIGEANCSGGSSTSPCISKPTLDVLTVGDGNFSFSLAYMRQQKAVAASKLQLRLVATSYDSYQELTHKYPESIRICAQLQELGATVLHRVDATNLEVSLQNAAADRKNAIPSHFDKIIFNHPHCGEENVQRHQSLLSHFYVSAQRLLRKTTGRIHLTLAEGQPERWQARERARDAGLCIDQEIEEVDNHSEYAVAYERKRHQNGKSFHRVLLHGERKEQASTLFIFALSGDGNGGDIGGKATASVDAVTRKRKLLDEPSPPPPVDRAIVAASPFTCEPCAKSFKTAQGLKTHVHMVHELGVVGGGAGAAAMPPTVTAIQCGHCVDRTFKDHDALRQHQISKHADDASIQPDWFTNRNKPTTTTSAGAAISPPQQDQQDQQVQQPRTCSICKLTFVDVAAFDAHWTQLQPKVVAQRLCGLCGRAFEEDRALRQHLNFCRARQHSEGDALAKSEKKQPTIKAAAESDDGIVPR